MAAQSKPVISPWGKAAAGATGAVLANALVYPLDMYVTSKHNFLLNPDLRSVKTRLQVQVRSKTSQSPTERGEPHYNSTWDALTKIVDEDGVRGLYAGMNGSLIGVASTNFAYFYWYSIVRTLYLKSNPNSTNPSTAVELALGAIAGAVAQIFTIPVAVVTTRQQTATKDERQGLLATAREVVNGPDGITGLWRGLKASLVLVINPAITYGAYERLKGVFFPEKANLRPWEAFCEFWSVYANEYSPC